MKREITCHCEQKLVVEIDDQYDISDGSESMNAIRNGTFLNVTCDRCGDVLRPEFAVNFARSDGRNVAFLPESERNHFMVGSVDIPNDSAVIIGTPELRETIALHDAALEREPIELVKYQILVRAGSGVGPPTDIRIYFIQIEDAELIFHIHGLRDEEIAVMRLPESNYIRAKDELPRQRRSEPYKTILDPPYVSIHKVELEYDRDAANG